MKTVKISFIVSAVFLMAVFMQSGCSGSTLKGTIDESGSTTVLPIAQKMANAFMEKNPAVNIITKGGGSSVGIDDVEKGNVDIGALSMESDYAKNGLNKYLLGHDGIAIIVHPLNPLKGLTKDQVVKIFSGEITAWDQLGGSGKITVITRETGSGTLSSFTAMVMGKTPIANFAIQEPSNDAIRTMVSTNPQAIGILSVGFTDSTVKSLNIDEVACNLDTTRSRQYGIVRPLYFLTEGTPNKLVQAFLDYSQSAEGQKLVRDEGYISVSQ